MATRKDLATIKAARSGDPDAQAALGRRYILGGDGLSKSEAAAYHWLSKAATQGHKEACVLIAEQISYGVIQNSKDRRNALWFKCAFDNGVRSAGVTFGRLVLEDLEDKCTCADSHVLVKEALLILEELAKEGSAEAKWMFFKLHSAQRQLGLFDFGDIAEQSVMSSSDQQVQEWLGHAADSGLDAARLALLEKLWIEQDLVEFQRRAEVFISAIFPRFSEVRLQYFGRFTPDLQMSAEVSTLLMRSAFAQEHLPDADASRLLRVLELAAMTGLPKALLQLGLLHAGMISNGDRVVLPDTGVDFEKATFCLSYDKLRTHPDALYALYLIHTDSNYHGRDVALGRSYLARSAQLGLAQAQFELGHVMWSSQQDEADNDIKAFYWWQMAKAQGHKGAEQCVCRNGHRAEPADWAVAARVKLLGEHGNAHPFLLARIELAAMFGLSKSEALAIDVKAADQGHCLLVDLRGIFPRGKRRLILIESGEQRALLDKTSRLFGNVDCGFTGPEGSYRARQERLMRLLRPS